jgi:predicted MFS family arabinose efflux permease
MTGTPAEPATSAVPRTTSVPHAYRLYVIAVLLVVYTCNFVDRVVLGILVTPIKRELHLTDTELGLLGGTAFALFYTSLGVPIGWLADRTNRVRIMTVALTLWSTFTALCGLAHGFGALFLARVGVGVGEAGGVAPAYSLITDYYPARLRARALGIYSMGIPLGSALGVYFGGYVATRFNWRTAFVALGLIGLALAPLLLGTVREPTRGASDAQPAGPQPTWGEVGRTLLRKPSFWLLSLGAAFGTIMGYGLLFWLPAFFQRTFGLTLLEVSRLMGSLLLIGGVSGLLLGGWLADRYGPQRPAAYALIPAIAFAGTLPCYLLGVSLPLGPLAFMCFLIPAALQLVWLGPLVAAVQRLVPASMRAVASAVFLFMINLLGLGLGSVLIGMASDRLAAHFGSASLRYAILGGNTFYLVAALLLIVAARRLPRDLEPG